MNADDCLNCLRTQFGHGAFKTEQWQVISSIINDKRDNFLGLKSGYGKSLCYQFPSVYLDTITIVISPFISLMQDQVNSLVERDIRACFLGSAQRNPQITADALAGKYNIVYMAPECALADEILTKLSGRLTLIAVDEAHFISRWGNSFRLWYRRLTAALRPSCPRVPILAIASTATINVRNDIINTLQMEDPRIHEELCLDRPNLKLIVKEISSSDGWADISPYLEETTGSIIIQCLTRNEAEDLNNVLKDHDVPCDVYHRDIGIENRERAQENFRSGRIKVIVSTVCFSMYKPDIRLMIHYGVADDVETYHQQIGISGRDGNPTKCVLFYDLKRNRLPQPRDDLLEYIQTTVCRRRFILSKLGSRLEDSPSCCDNCCMRFRELQN